MDSQHTRSIKKAKKESLFYQELSKLIHQIIMDEPELASLTFNRVRLSEDSGICFMLFYTPEGKALFDKLLPKLILYKPSLRKSLAHAIRSRYTPDLVFQYDEQFEKQQRIEELLNKIGEKP
ncbi:MAG: ribosome-binding factor A [Candidatus Dependentiae bacterium]